MGLVKDVTGDSFTYVKLGTLLNRDGQSECTKKLFQRHRIRRRRVAAVTSTIKYVPMAPQTHKTYFVGIVVILVELFARSKAWLRFITPPSRWRG